MAKRRAFTRKRVNPLHKKVSRISAPKLNFDGSTVSVTSYTAMPNTALGVLGGFITVDCSQASGTIVTGVGASHAVANSILQRYSQYRYNSLAIEWIPSLGPASVDAGTRIHFAYLDNAEKMVNYATTPTLNFIRGCRNIASFNAWERFTYRVPLTWRRKVFDTNIALGGGTTADEFERSTQGMVLIFVESITPILANYGTLKQTSSVRVHELNVTLGS